VQVPGSNILQLFYRDPNNGLSSFWQNPGGIWSSEQHLGGDLAGDPIAGPTTQQSVGVLQLFYRGNNDVPNTLSRDPGGSWSAEQQLGGLITGNRIAVVIQAPDLGGDVSGGTQNPPRGGHDQ